MSNFVPAPTLYTKEITDPLLRRNFEALSAYFQANNQLLNFRFFEIVEAGAVPQGILTHGLGFLPKDIIPTLITGPGTLTWNVAKFSSTTLSYSTTGACRVRLLVGTYNQDQSTVQASSTDLQSIQAQTPVTTTTSLGTPVSILGGTYVCTGQENFLGVTGSIPSTTIRMVTPASGREVTIKKVAGTYPVTITFPGFIDNRTGPLVITLQGQSFTLIPGPGTNWYTKAFTWR